ncbi:MAG: dephospho-CoA kinase [Planctomycetes bacterium]|nr:dephospho-CoA kinase [Planctomycetota bacterium]
MPKPFVLGVVGMPGSGKSFLCSELEQLGAAYISADALGHEILEEVEIQKQLQGVFGDDVVKKGVVDRALLANRAFPAGRADELNAICHPAIHKRIITKIAELSSNALIVLEAAILFEAGFDEVCSTSLFVKTPFEIRLERVKKTRNWSERELKSRDSCQNELLKGSKADLVINGALAIESFRAGIHKLHETIPAWMLMRNDATCSYDDFYQYIKTCKLPDGINVRHL